MVAPPASDPLPRATRDHTAARRALQPLWNALSQGPSSTQGWLLAVSGGPDSRALLESVARFSGRSERVEVACVDHGHRTSAAAEVDAVVARARALGFTAHALQAESVGADEAAWRSARSRVLAACAAARGLAVVVTAHHEGDAAEAALLSFLGQGGGPRGAAPPVIGTLPEGGLTLWRPFSRLPASTLRAALSEVGAADVVQDDDDARGRGRRAGLRHRVLQALGADRAAATARLAKGAARARDDDEVLVPMAAALAATPDPLPASTPRALLRRALQIRARTLSAGRGKDARRAHAAVETALVWLARGRRGVLDVPGGVLVVDAAGASLVAATVPQPQRRAGPMSDEPQGPSPLADTHRAKTED